MMLPRDELWSEERSALKRLADEIESWRERGRMRLIFEGGPRDGEERDTMATPPIARISFASEKLTHEGGNAMSAVYELREWQKKPHELARYRFIGWKPVGVA